MKREGRQHGMVRTYRILPSPWNPNPESRFVQQFDSPPTAGLFTKVPLKPTNHSKFTGRCGRPRCLGCHMHPACKSKDKSKGSHKLRSREMVTSYRLITWRVVDGRHGLKDSEFSASRILDHLSNHYDDDDDDDDECVVDDGFKVNSQEPLGEMEHCKGETEENIIVDHNKDDDDDVKNDGVHVDDDDVRFVLDQDLEGGGWCLVGDD
ncbi:hypothetical protein ES319_A09G035000v1 [Gossypium barbadense]|uniref:Uncharacterized protein n=3 Tax=Gossypium TaxID=3633 RepID=A0A2P5Y486_GOSBA|nr:hypothetical protein ES319_A09G035000v1 [Gossypium barbadense]PPS10410.1 hypothetical protein GOBAR_AA10232 [Gossypium barbadense]TYH01246.1 hypothetical protein ES288_A09G042900v1 [Gossypium darwinii]TYI08999.1 hypothetical protein ES332_A09G040900v1 [Gossypium tomentosum]